MKWNPELVYWAQIPEPKETGGPKVSADALSALLLLIIPECKVQKHPWET